MQAVLEVLEAKVVACYTGTVHDSLLSGYVYINKKNNNVYMCICIDGVTLRFTRQTVGRSSSCFASTPWVFYGIVQGVAMCYYSTMAGEYYSACIQVI